MRRRVIEINESYLERLDALEQWLASLGFRSQTRIHQAIEMVREVATNFVSSQKNKTSASEEVVTPLGYAHANQDVIEFLDIFDAFANAPVDEIVPKLERALSGPFMPVFETRENAVGRNTQFELALAAEWRIYGLKVSIGEPDLTLHVGKTNYAIECKRPLKEESIRPNIRHAKNQLEGRLNRNQTLFGVIAISISRILFPGTLMYCKRSDMKSVYNNPALLQRALIQEQRLGKDPFRFASEWAKGTGKDIEELMQRCRWSKFEFHERVIAMRFHNSAPGLGGRVAISMLAPVGDPGPAFVAFQTETENAYQMR